MTRKVRAKQIWRPPSASDHNAMAAAADSHRRGIPGNPPAETAVDIFVKTPAGGIAARSGNTIYSEWCAVVVETRSGAGEKTLKESGNTVEVFNVYPDAVTGEVIVPTGLTIWGTRYVTGEPCGE